MRGRRVESELMGSLGLQSSKARTSPTSELPSRIDTSQTKEKETALHSGAAPWSSTSHTVTSTDEKKSGGPPAAKSSTDGSSKGKGTCGVGSALISSAALAAQQRSDAAAAAARREQQEAAEQPIKLAQLPLRDLGQPKADGDGPSDAVVPDVV